LGRRWRVGRRAGGKVAKARRGPQPFAAKGSRVVLGELLGGFPAIHVPQPGLGGAAVLFVLPGLGEGVPGGVEVSGLAVDDPEQQVGIALIIEAALGDAFFESDARLAEGWMSSRELFTGTLVW